MIAATNAVPLDPAAALFSVSQAGRSRREGECLNTLPNREKLPQVTLFSLLKSVYLKITSFFLTVALVRRQTRPRNLLSFRWQHRARSHRLPQRYHDKNMVRNEQIPLTAVLRK